MNFAKIRRRLTRYLDAHNINLQAFFMGITKTREYVTRDDLKAALALIGLDTFDEEQIDELYAFLDADRSGRISFDEMDAAIFNVRVNVGAVLRRLRRAVVN